MATTLDWVKSVRADIRGDCGKGWNLRGREVGGKMVMQIDRNDENGRSTLLTNIGWRKDNKRNILNAIVEIKDFMYHNGDSLKEAFKKINQIKRLFLNNLTKWYEKILRIIKVSK